MLDQVCKCPSLNEKAVAMFGETSQNLKKTRLNQKKQTLITDFLRLLK